MTSFRKVVGFSKRSLSRAHFPSATEGLRAMAEKAPQAEAFVETWISRLRPLFMGVYEFRRRIATVAVFLLAGGMFVHVMFGANGMVVYKQKRAEYQELQKKIGVLQQENEEFTQKIRGLKSDSKAIEKEAREQMHYAKPGEYVYVPPTPADSTPPANRSAKK